MQIKNLSPNISFKKTITASCAINQGCQKGIDCSIYKIDPIKDKDYFKLLGKKKIGSVLNIERLYCMK